MKLLTLHDWRLLRKLSQLDLAIVLEVSQASVSLAEKGIVNSKFALKFVLTYGDEHESIKELRGLNAKKDSKSKKDLKTA